MPDTYQSQATVILLFFGLAEWTVARDDANMIAEGGCVR